MAGISVKHELFGRQNRLARRISLVMMLIFVMDSLQGFGFLKVGFPGITPFSMASTTFIRPDNPAAGSECPMLLLIYSD